MMIRSCACTTGASCDKISMNLKSSRLDEYQKKTNNGSDRMDTKNRKEME